MRNVAKFGIAGFAVWFCSTASFLSAQTNAYQAQQAQMEKADRQKLVAMEKLIKASVRSFNIIGRVVDQDGQPVPGVAVIIQIQGYGLFGELPGLDIREKTWKTDRQGFFKCKNVKGIKLILKNIEKNGYEFQRTNAAGLEFEAVNANPDFKPDPNQPLVFRLRKKNEPAYVIAHEYSGRFATNRASYVMNLAAGANDYPGRLDEDGLVRDYVPPVSHVDLTMESNFDPQTGFTIRLVPTDPAPGIMEQNQLLYTAPETGYQTNAINLQFIFTAARQHQKRYYYLRGRNGQLFSRLEIEYRPNMSAPHVLFSVKTYANPAGSRNLEYDPTYNYYRDHPEFADEKRRQK